MALVRRRVVGFVKKKKGQPPRQPGMQLNTARAEEKSLTGAPHEAVVVHAHPVEPRPWWKMAWIPVLVLLAIAVFLGLAAGVGDNLRSSDTRRTEAKVDGGGGLKQKQQAYPGNEAALAAHPENRQAPTDDSFLSTHYRKSGGAAAGGGGGNGGVPSGGSAKGRAAADKPSANCVLTFGGDNDKLSEKLDDCLAKR